MPVIIDGYNLLWSLQKTGQEEAEAVDEVGLCRILGRYFKLRSETGQIIFDGNGPADKSGFNNVTNLEIFFSGFAGDADDVIENKIKADTAPKRLMIVSSDRRLIKAAHARKAEAVKSEEFWKMVQKQLAKKKHEAEPEGKRRGLSPGETKQWLKFFDLDE
jgi:predicted RNA-binding protein with PIN domain